MKLILKLIAGILAGILFGLFAPDVLVQILITMKALISQLIGFTIPLLILFFVTSGIANLPKNSGKLLGKTVGLSYLSTMGAGAMAYLVAGQVLPSMLHSTAEVSEAARTLAPLIDLKIPPIMGVMTALAVAFIFGLGITATNSEHLRKLSDEGRDIIELFLAKVMVPSLPFYIAGVFADMTVKGTVFSTLKTFTLVLVLIVALHWLWLTFQFISTGALLGRSPLKLLKTMLPAYVTALGTMSSAASLPVTLRQTEQNGVKKPIANFVVPLCANIHMSGSAISITSVCVAVILVTGNATVPSFIEALPFIGMLGITMVAAPGAPGGAVMAAVGLLGSMMGFTEAMIGLQIALHLAQDGFGTACNITGDGALALWVDKFADEAVPGEVMEAEAATTSSEQTA
ncbi:dicarboxylate/amino acid:cation symporter [Photobacterium sp. BZF1]|uniref:Dicarboxylate/amino acid:cation symporter n=1 Tax=Photobacterium rosenbergii TaxID=294936 RepID=A0A2T3N7C8_9GAMM|nr:MULTISPECIES: dicarboxylate/amino acid:cation symporter [Photobacterium]MBC7005800.1 dicarboxylate/amino acid:cation symporter [Photobacterium sp. BZF1]PSW08882.1 dicarboxylate/amino acid:cation symporter [Photobacterium rosenbergii]